MQIHTNNCQSNRALRRHLMAVATTAALAGFAGQASAVSFGNPDGFHGTISTTVAYGIALRAADRDDDLVGKAALNPGVSALGLGTAAQRAAQRGDALLV